MGSENSGRKENMKMKTYLIYQYLMRNTDENNRKSASDIAAYLTEDCGIPAENRAIYKDINDLNKALWLVEHDADIDDLSFAIEENEYEKSIVYDSHKKGFYVKNRRYSTADIRLISELIYSSKYITEPEAKRLVEIMKDFISYEQAEEIKTDALVLNRSRTLNKATLENVSTIYEAMKVGTKDNPHIPEKISFKYLKTAISDLKNQIEKKSGELYVVSPYKLIINDGNYYLLGYSDSYQQMRIYRVDRMKNLKRTGMPRIGAEEFKKMDLRTFMQRTFQMFVGEPQEVRLRFEMQHLDTVLEKLGRDNTVSYTKDDDNHFRVSAMVEVSNMFFSWLCGFGTGVKILYPANLQEQYIEYLNDILRGYEK